MSNPALFFAIAGISMSFAGFAGLFLALRPRDAKWEMYEVGQVNTIVLYALLTMFSALIVVPLASLVGEDTALRVMSAVSSLSPSTRIRSSSAHRGSRGIRSGGACPDATS